MLNSSIFTNVINSYLPEPHASLLNGMVFGTAIGFKTDFYSKLRSVGLLHIVVLSGSNISLLLAIVARFFSFFSKWISSLLSILFIILFILFVKPQAPIVRAGIMGSLTLVAFIFGRKTYAFYTLLLSAFFIGAFFPKWLTSISFQLSFTSTLGILIFGKEFNKEKNLTKIAELKSFIKEEVRLSIAAQIFTLPIILFYFKQVSLISPVANLLVSFTIAPLMILGIILSVFGNFFWLLGLPVSILSFGLLNYFVAVVDILSSIPYASIRF